MRIAQSVDQSLSMQMVQRHLSVTAVQDYLAQLELQVQLELRGQLALQELVVAVVVTEHVSVLVHLESALAMMLSK
jgi:hypothetical protein